MVIVMTYWIKLEIIIEQLNINKIIMAKVWDENKDRKFKWLSIEDVTCKIDKSKYIRVDCTNTNTNINKIYLNRLDQDIIDNIKDKILEDKYFNIKICSGSLRFLECKLIFNDNGVRIRFQDIFRQNEYRLTLEDLGSLLNLIQDFNNSE